MLCQIKANDENEINTKTKSSRIWPVQPTRKIIIGA